jgi:hypothetical protein
MIINCNYCTEHAVLALSVFIFKYKMGTRGSFSRTKQPGESDHLPPSAAEVENRWKCTSTLPYILMVWCLTKHRIHLHGVVLCGEQGEVHLYFLVFNCRFVGKQKET